ncbi:MAG: 4Fe-4S dicluster domain-containing protein [Anaerolineae bacterium]
MVRKTISDFFAKALRLEMDEEKLYEARTTELGRVASDQGRCVQCGICSYNCPIGISVRDYARQGLPVIDPGCITCGQCIDVCPRGTLRWETELHEVVASRYQDTTEAEHTSDDLLAPIFALDQLG